MLVAASVMMLAACAPTQTIEPTIRSDISCVAFEPITFDHRTDSKETVAQIREFNAAWRAICDDGG